jgi:hypothetical protein
VERCGQVIPHACECQVVVDTKTKTLQTEIQQHVLVGSAIFIDALKSYDALDDVQHVVVDHAVEYCAAKSTLTAWRISGFS